MLLTLEVLESAFRPAKSLTSWVPLCPRSLGFSLLMSKMVKAAGILTSRHPSAVWSTATMRYVSRSPRLTEWIKEGGVLYIPSQAPILSFSAFIVSSQGMDLVGWKGNQIQGNV